MTRKPQKEVIREYLAANPASTAQEVAEGTGIKRSSVGAVIRLMRDDDLLRVVSETAGPRGLTHLYGIASGTEATRSAVDIVYDTLLDSGRVTAREAAERAGISVKRAVSAITTLRGSGRVESVGVTPTKHGVVHMYQAVSEERATGYEEVIRRSIALGGGPFGLMAAQLGVEA